MSQEVDLSALKINRPKGGYDRGSSSGRLIQGVFLLLFLGLAYRFYPDVRALLKRPDLEIRTRTVSRRRVVSSGGRGMAANGHIVAARRAALSADTPGRIVELNVEEGTPVTRGQIVARLFSEEYEAALRRAEAEVQAAVAEMAQVQQSVAIEKGEVQRLSASIPVASAGVRVQDAALALAKTELERAETLARKRASNQQVLDQARGNVQTTAALRLQAKARETEARAAVSQAKKRIDLMEAQIPIAMARLEQAKAAKDQAQATFEKTIVKAPFTGIVVLKDAEVGEVVSPNVTGGASSRGAIVTLIDPASLEVQAEVPETSLSEVRIGGPVEVYLDADPSEPIAGSVSRIWPTANRQKATVEVRVKLEPTDFTLRPDMGVRAVFVSKEASQNQSEPPSGPPPLTIPENCIAERQGKRGAFLVETPKVRFRELRFGETVSGSIDVLEGLSEGDRVVLNPPDTLSTGDTIRIVTE